jgi:predicted RNase H-like HicB family nuclease
MPRSFPASASSAVPSREVERLIREAIVLHLESLRAHGDPIPPPSAVAATLVEVPAA